MPKILVKGGIWKNTEDEILKVAVMKYGKNQWSRIASLLHRKTAKQCKSRWYEWLDPGIKKTEWTKEEEEKLLHLAKLMPTQWRTIAPMVGRTANQCLERYEYLLDQAQIQESGLNDQDDPRKLRPGEVDPNPETKPARPDPIDMDEDELEMLSEARARLANTQGKKAKRKAREKQLDEARRLATLQKKRELRSAGCNLILLQKIKRCCDLNFEIPFEKKAPVGFFDTSTEKIDPNSDEFKELRLKEYTRRDRTEILERRKDKEKYDKAKEQDLMSVLKKNAPTITIRRSKLVLPNPQISQSELEEVIKLGAEADSAKKLVEDDSLNFPTNSLLHDYSMTPITTNESLGMRTPLSTDILIKEAQTILALNRVETPLKGGINTPIDYKDMAMGEKGTAPKSTPVQTANTVLSSPFTAPTPGRQEKEFTPLRDSLSINKDSNYSSVNSTPYNSKQKAQISEQIRQKFTILPTPKPMDIEMLEIEKNQTSLSDLSLDITPDAGEEEARLEKLRKIEESKKEILIPESLKCNLPIPNSVSKYKFTSLFDYDDDYLLKAEKMIYDESNRFIQKIIQSKDTKYIDGFKPEEIEKARALLFSEMSDLSIEDKFKINFSENWTKIHAVSNGIIERKNDEVNNKKIMTELLNNKEIISKNQKNIKKLQDKIKIIYGGYAQRRDKLMSQIDDLIDKNIKADLELHAYKYLQVKENQSGIKRLDNAQQYVDMVKSTEEHLQKIYTEILRSQMDKKEIKHF